MSRPLILMAPDETTRAFIDMYARREVDLIKPPIDDGSLERLRKMLARDPDALIVAQLPGRRLSGAALRLASMLALGAGRAAGLPDVSPLLDVPPWAPALGLRAAHEYALPNGRRYALLETIR